MGGYLLNHGELAAFFHEPGDPLNPRPGDHMATIWKGSLTFGLVNIPVRVFPATAQG